MLSPFVYWAQSETILYLRIDLCDVKVLILILKIYNFPTYVNFLKWIL